jgi:ActR/RegA family two-component response regulator
LRVLPIEDDEMIGTADQQALKERGLPGRLGDQRKPAVRPAESEACKFALLHLGLAKIGSWLACSCGEFARRCLLPSRLWLRAQKRLLRVGDARF